MILWPKTSKNNMIYMTASKKIYLCDPFLEQTSLLIEFETQPTFADWVGVNENLIAIALSSCFLFIVGFFL